MSNSNFTFTTLERFRVGEEVKVVPLEVGRGIVTAVNLKADGTTELKVQVTYQAFEIRKRGVTTFSEPQPVNISGLAPLKNNNADPEGWELY